MASTLYPMSDQHQGNPEKPTQSVGVVCPYCGHAQAAIGAVQSQCASCKGLFDPLSRQATQNAMGPWWVLNPARPTGPGLAYEKLAELARRGKITKTSIVRGPTTRQFWALARDTAGVAVLLGECHNCHREVMPDEFICGSCNTVLAPRSDRQHLGLAPVQLLPGEATPNEIAASTRAHTPPQQPQAPHAAPRPQPVHPMPTPMPRAHPANPEVGPSSARRMRQQMARLQMYLIILLVFVGVLVAAVALLILDPFEGVTFGPSKPQDSAITSPDTASPASTQSTPREQPTDTAPGDAEPPTENTGVPEINLPEMPPPITDDAPLDAALEPWRERYERAVALEHTDTIQSVSEAISIIESILAEARSQDMTGDATYPLARDRLEALRDRLEILELEEQFADDPIQ